MGVWQKLAVVLVLGLLAGILALILTAPLSPLAGTERTVIAVLATVFVFWITWDVADRPRKQREVRAQEKTDLAVPILEEDALQATILFAEAAALFPNQRAYLNLACALHCLGRLDLAKSYYQRAGAPGYEDASIAGASRVELARIALREEDWEWARRYATQALDILPNTEVDDRATALVIRALANWRSADHVSAKEDLATARSLNPNTGHQRGIAMFESMISVTDAALRGFDEVFEHLEMYRDPTRWN